MTDKKNQSGGQQQTTGSGGEGTKPKTPRQIVFDSRSSISLHEERASRVNVKKPTPPDTKKK
ncbi:hypothetical protein [Rhodoblastus sp.]|uniref:hypothetical protein n=1 Tax=Rhodoblastus sp. TaxID=1962975 RepID=UPI002602750C|nr:hypothetical protein [Rhodoblastus sp.]